MKSVEKETYSEEEFQILKILCMKREHKEIVWREEGSTLSQMKEMWCKRK